MGVGGRCIVLRIGRLGWVRWPGFIWQLPPICPPPPPKTLSSSKTTKFQQFPIRWRRHLFGQIRQLLTNSSKKNRWIILVASDCYFFHSEIVQNGLFMWQRWLVIHRGVKPEYDRWPWWLWDHDGWQQLPNDLSISARPTSFTQLFRLDYNDQ